MSEEPTTENATRPLMNTRPIRQVNLSVAGGILTLYFEEYPSPAELAAAIRSTAWYQDNPDLFAATIRRVRTGDYSAVTESLYLNGR
jgi:hypothetical protein